MTRWERASAVGERCGGCGAEVPAEAPYLAYYAATAAAKPRRFVRCGACEGGAPPDLPADIVHEETPQPAIDFTRLGLLPITFTGRQPGEDDQ